MFCPSCGNNTLIRTSVGIDECGKVTYYLKKNFQYNNRGSVFDISLKNTGHAHKSHSIILREDQKEFEKAIKQKRVYDKKMLNSDAFDVEFGSASKYSANLLSSNGRPVIGHGRRNVNAVTSGRRRK